MYIRWTEAAVDDLKTISAHIERDRSLAAANKVCRAIYDAIQTSRNFLNQASPESRKVRGSL
jgi:plasmid stabilization system protein ParE